MALREVLAEMPFPVRHIQVDGGSEFMGEFELACMEAGIPLIVLPPRSPKLNSHVERANGTDRHEFFGFYEVGTTVAEVRRAAKVHLQSHPPAQVLEPHPARKVSCQPRPQDGGLIHDTCPICGEPAHAIVRIRAYALCAGSHPGQREYRTLRKGFLKECVC